MLPHLRYEYSWSPDGTSLVFDADVRIDIVTVNTGEAMTWFRAGPTPAAGEGATCGRRIQPVMAPVFSPDGTRIVFASSRGIEMARSDGSERRIVVQKGCLPTWSPDGNRIAFIANSGVGADRLDVYVVNQDGTDERNLSAQIALKEGDQSIPSLLGVMGLRPAWSPDGNEIVFKCVVEATLLENFEAGVFAVSADGMRFYRMVTLGANETESEVSWTN